uniref:Phosphoribosyl pyrophosphate synthase-associated protein 2 n=1 Tax=Oncorhynchus mykiss TaxID=8022 RepID=A0A8K9XUD2_ONCMY
MVPPGRSPPVMNHTEGGLVIFSANSHPSSREISKRIGERLGVELGKVQVYQEDNRETRVQIQESVRGKDVFIIQTVSKDVITTIMGCEHYHHGVYHRGGPYFPYSKQCKMRKRGSIVSKLLASMMCKAGEDTHLGETHTADTQRHIHHRYTETHRDTNITDTHRDTETHRKTQRHRERHIDAQKETEIHRKTQRHKVWSSY